MQQNIVLSIQDRLQQLPKSERKIAEYILKNTETVISMNAQELAKQAGNYSLLSFYGCEWLHRVETFIICKSWPNEAANVY